MMQRRIVACVAALALAAAACGDSGTGVDREPTLEGSFALRQVDGTPLPIELLRIVNVDTAGAAAGSCTEYLTEMTIDVTSSGAVTRSESHERRCDGGAGQTLFTIESGSASKTADGWRLDFLASSATATRYFGRLDGTKLTIVRREMNTASLVLVDLSRLVFERV